VLGALLIAGLRLRGLGLFRCMLAGACAIENSALVTGMDFENHRWVYASAPMAEILFMGMVARGFEKGREHLGWVLRILRVMPVGMLFIAVLFRPFEALKAEESAINSQLLAEQRPLRAALGTLSAECSLAGPKEADVALLFSRAGQLYQVPHTSQTSLISDREVNERHALNAWLMGFERADYAAEARPETWRRGVAADTADELDTIAQNRLAIFDALEKDGAPALLARYRPCALLLPTGAAPPRRGGVWTSLAKSPRWTLWRVASGEWRVESGK